MAKVVEEKSPIDWPEITAEESYTILITERKYLDLDARTVLVGQDAVELTSHEFNILSFLVERPGRAVTRRQLAEHALPESGARYDRTVDSHMSRIRNKLGDDAAGHIKTVWGVGYKFEPPQASE